MRFPAQIIESHTDTQLNFEALQTQLPQTAVSAAPPSGGDDANNIAAAIQALGGGPGTIQLARGVYRTGSPLNIDDRVGIQFRGAGGASAGARPGTTLTYTGTASPFVSARSISGFSLVDVQAVYSNASFTGTMFDFSHSGGLGTDANSIVFERCGIGGAGIRTALGVSLDNAIIASFRDTSFYNMTNAVRGRSVVGSYSNVVSFDGNCAFTGMVSAPILNPGQAWSFRGATFENLNSGNAGAIGSSLSGIAGLTAEGCWFGDANTSGIWIDCPMTGASIRGNYFATGQVGVNLQASSAGVEVSGNLFASMNTGIGVGTGCTDLKLIPNAYSSVTTNISFAALPDRSLYTGSTFPAPLMASQFWGRDGLVTKAGNTTGLSSAQIDALFTDVPGDGALLVDTTNNVFLQRAGGKWYKTAALTLIP